MNGLEENKSGTVLCEVRDAFTETSKQEVAALGFESHGMVIYDASGAVSWKQDGHSMTREQVVTEVGGALDRTRSPIGFWFGKTTSANA